MKARRTKTALQRTITVQAQILKKTTLATSPHHWPGSRSSGKWKSYEGKWADGVQHGAGTLFDHEGNKYKGVFKQGKLERWDGDQ